MSVLPAFELSECMKKGYQKSSNAMPEKFCFVGSYPDFGSVFGRNGGTVLLSYSQADQHLSPT